MAITCDLCKKRAQVFPVGGSFSPTKASVYLRTALYDNTEFWNLDTTPVISMSNFASRTANTTAQILPTTSASAGFDSKSALLVDSNGGSDWPVLNFPIKTGVTGSFDVYVYYANAVGAISANILIDNQVETTMSGALSASWTWSSAGTITIGDTNQHTLGIQMTSTNTYVDKIIIQPNGDPAPGAVALSDSPYNTVHAQFYITSSETPLISLSTHDYQTTLTDIKQDGWFNFDLSYRVGSHSYALDNYALVLWAEGSREKNYVSWELLESAEYLDLPVAAED